MNGPFKRLRKELVIVREGVDEDILLSANHDDLLEWHCHIRGPSESPYEDGVFKLEIRCPEQYPLRPPTIRFVTPIFHPNIHFVTGEICIDILKDEWSPAWTLREACRAIRALLAAPNADSPLNCDAGNLIRGGDVEGAYFGMSKTRGFRATARKCVEDFARAPMPTAAEVDAGTNKPPPCAADDAASKADSWRWLWIGVPGLVIAFLLFAP